MYGQAVLVALALVLAPLGLMLQSHSYEWETVIVLSARGRLPPSGIDVGKDVRPIVRHGGEI